MNLNEFFKAVKKTKEDIRILEKNIEKMRVVIIGKHNVGVTYTSYCELDLTCVDLKEDYLKKIKDNIKSINGYLKNLYMEHQIVFNKQLINYDDF